MIYLSLVDKVDAAQVILDPEIYDRISDDNCPPREDFDMPNADYWGGYVDGELASINIEEAFRDGRKIHFQVLKRYRWAARELLNISLPEGPVYAEIPECFKTTINFARNAGFRTIEIKPKCYLKNGEMHDRYLMRLDNEFCH